MKLTITTYDDQIFHLEVPDDIELENLKAYCEMESGISSSEFSLIFNGESMTDGKKSVQQYGVGDGDMLYLQQSMSHATAQPTLPPMDFSGIRIPRPSQQAQSQRASTSQPAQASSGQRQYDPYVLRQLLLENPRETALLKQNNPPLADALLSGDPGMGVWFYLLTCSHFKITVYYHKKYCIYREVCDSLSSTNGREKKERG